MFCDLEKNDCRRKSYTGLYVLLTYYENARPGNVLLKSLRNRSS